MPKTCRARLAIPANNFVGSCAYNQSRVRPRQSSLSISPRRETNLLAHARHNPQVVEPFIDVVFCCCHRESSTVVDSTLPIFRKTVNQTAECGLDDASRTCSGRK